MVNGRGLMGYQWYIDEGSGVLMGFNGYNGIFMGVNVRLVGYWVDMNGIIVTTPLPPHWK